MKKLAAIILFAATSLCVTLLSLDLWLALTEPTLTTLHSFAFWRRFILTGALAVGCVIMGLGLWFLTDDDK